MRRNHAKWKLTNEMHILMREKMASATYSSEQRRDELRPSHSTPCDECQQHADHPLADEVMRRTKAEKRQYGTEKNDHLQMKLTGMVMRANHRVGAAILPWTRIRWSGCI
jgi:hypothetical protein